MDRSNNRGVDEIRAVNIQRNFIRNADGSVLYKAGNTWVVCTATVEDSVPPFLKGAGTGWVTAEYGMLPRATEKRTSREASRGKQGGRTLEIQRLIGRSLRSVIDMILLGERTVIVDCDVIQADGGTRTASISGGYIALVDAIRSVQDQYEIPDDVIKGQVGAVSVGIINKTPVLDLDYLEDKRAETDMNVVMTSDSRFVEVQGTAEGEAFSFGELNDMLRLAEKGIKDILRIQKAVMG